MRLIVLAALVAGALTAGFVLRQPEACAGTLPATSGSREAEMSYTEMMAGMGARHHYPLTAEFGAQDVIGDRDGTNRGGVDFDSQGARFGGRCHLALADSDDFSVATTGGLSIVVFLTIEDWRGRGGDGENVHWLGKGSDGQHEWTFRHYVAGGGGQAPQRQGRVSFYLFNPGGGLGVGSYVQDPPDGEEHVIVATCDATTARLYKDGSLRDADLLSRFGIVPRNGRAPVRVGTRDLTTGFLAGRVRRLTFFNRVLSADEVELIHQARELPE